ncbi:hypothetical protein [Desulfallas thermosapovorans]|nr:hypothetical protein [Desulfallas thermosapovorans]
MENKITAYKCKDCGMIFWAKKEDEPRFCPFCESALIIEHVE